MFTTVFAGTFATDFFLFFLTYKLWIPLGMMALTWVIVFWKYRPQSLRWLVFSSVFFVISLTLFLLCTLAKFQTLAWIENSGKHLKTFGTRSNTNP